MTSIGGDGKFWGEEGKDGRSDPGSASGVCQISRGGEELLVDFEFFSGKTLALSGKPIAFSHIISKTADVSLQSRVAEISDGSVDKATTGMSGGEDLEGVVSKEPWFSKIRGGAWIRVKITEINSCDWTLATFNLRVECFSVVPDPLAGMSRSSFFIIDPGGFFGKRVVLYPS
jgi:hypothetical protein